MKTTFQTHDLTLPAWGPYTKKYSGISHVPAANDGTRFDLAVFPGLYRRRVDVPNVRYESGFHVWAAAPDLSCYTLRHELIWKDQVYVDVSFAPLEDGARLIRAECRNDSAVPQNLVLHYMASAWDPVPANRSVPITGCDVELPEKAAFVLAKDHEDLRFAVPRPMDGLCWDGMRRGEEAQEGFTAGYGIGQNFGCAPARGPFGQPLPCGAGDWVRFRMTLDGPLERPALGVRYVNPAAEASRYTLATGEELTLEPSAEPRLVFVPLEGHLAAGSHDLELTAAGTGAAKLDCLVLCEEAEASAVRFTPREPGYRPELRVLEDERIVTLRYPHIREAYAVAWDDVPWQLRQIEHDELDIFLRDTVHDHVHDVLRGNGKGHYTNVFQRPIPLEPGQSRVLWGVVCRGEDEAAALGLCRRALADRESFEAVWQAAARAMEPRKPLPEGEGYAFGQQLMQAVLCTNVVYPVYTRGQYIRHNTPGRWWDSLYTWDSGFIGMGLAQFSQRRAFDCLNAYLTAPGDDEAAFIHHGSMVPTQFYLFAELWNRTCSRELVEYCYPRLLQYYDFISGHAAGSTTANLGSGLLRPWDYFYNSGGWDDYPPQAAVHRQRLQARCTPVVTTAHVIRCAKILARAAAFLGREEDSSRLTQDALRMTKALNDHAWDGEAGYFGYVLHDDQGRPQGPLRHESGANYNMGLGGASPLFAGACSPEQAQTLWEKLEDGRRLWTSCGLSTVDQTAPYYRRDGYWNGAVWMPYQWLFFKAALDAGRTDFAFRLARALLELWQGECRESYHCFEHFMIDSRRGAGWHQFSGLSSPIVQFFAAYYRPGTLTTGWDTFVRQAEWSGDLRRVRAVLECGGTGAMSVLVVTAPESGSAQADVPGAKAHRRFDGLWELTWDLPAPRQVVLEIR